MPVVAMFEFPGEDIAYHKVFEVSGPAILEQPQRLSHICYRTDGGFTVVDVWQDEAAFAAFGRSSAPLRARPASTPSHRCTRWRARSPRTAPVRRTDRRSRRPVLRTLGIGRWGYDE